MAGATVKRPVYEADFYRRTAEPEIDSAVCDADPKRSSAALWEPSPADPVHVVAHHECGHVIVAIYQRAPLHSVEIYSDGSGGRFRNVAETYNHQELDAAAERQRSLGGVEMSVLRPTLVSFLAGPIAEHRFSGNAIWLRDDLNTAQILLDTTNLSPVQRRDLTNECLGEARRIIDEFWGVIEVLAIRLISRRYLDADEIRECIHNVGAMGQRLLGVEVRTYKNPEMRYRPMILTLAPSK